MSELLKQVNEYLEFNVPKSGQKYEIMAHNIVQYEAKAGTVIEYNDNIEKYAYTIDQALNMAKEMYKQERWSHIYIKWDHFYMNEYDCPVNGEYNYVELWNDAVQ